MRRVVAMVLVVAAGAFVESFVEAVEERGDACCIGGQTDDGPSVGGSGSGSAVSSWVVGADGGGVVAPSGGSCSGWKPAAGVDPEAQPSDVGTVKVDPDGVVAVLYYRDCGGVRQFVWVRQEPPRVIAELALADRAWELLEAPVVAVSPPGRAVVNVETWLAVVDPGVVSATASIPGLSATVEARVAESVWEFADAGSGGDVVEVVCPGVGVGWSPAVDVGAGAPCGVTFGSVWSGGVGRVELVWEVSWWASNGASGSLPSVRSDPAVFDYPVDEIQTIGVRG